MWWRTRWKNLSPQTQGHRRIAALHHAALKVTLDIDLELTGKQRKGHTWEAFMEHTAPVPRASMWPHLGGWEMWAGCVHRKTRKRSGDYWAGS